MRKSVFLLVFILLFIACDRQSDDSFLPIAINDNFFAGSVTLEKLTHLEGYRLSAISNDGTKNDLHIKFPVYHFETGDINHDGKTDILIGVIKSTRFHPEIGKRLFLMQLDSGKIRPLWLGSKVCRDLVDFRSVSLADGDHILTIEKGQDNIYYNGLYQWQDFGLLLSEDKYKSDDYSSSLKYFQNEIK